MKPSMALWNRIPKTRFVEFQIFELAVFDAVAHFNIENNSLHC